MKKYISTLLFTCTLLFTSIVASQNRATPLPDLDTCEGWAEKKGTILERYLTADNYLGCMVAGASSALMEEALNLLKNVTKTKEKFHKEKAAGARYFHLRKARQLLYLSTNTFDYVVKNINGIKDERARSATLNYINRKKPELKKEFDWINAQFALIDAKHPDIKELHQKATQNITDKCKPIYASYANGTLKNPETNFLDLKKYRSVVAECAEVKINFYDVLPGVKKVYPALKKPVKIPNCGGSETKNGWQMSWTNSTFTLKPTLYDVKSPLAKSSVEITRTRSHKLLLNFNYNSGSYNSRDVQQLFVDGVKIHEGNWTILRNPDGSLKSAKSPEITASVFYKLEKGKVCELRVVRKLMIKDATKKAGFRYDTKVYSSVKFSLQHFKELKKNAQFKVASASIDKMNGKCKG